MRENFRPHYQTRSQSMPVKKSRQTNRWQFRQSLFWLIADFILLLVIYLLLQKTLVVRQVYCTINNSSTPCSQSLQNATQNLIGQPLLFQNYEKNFANLADQHLYISNLSYHKIFPGTLFINFNFPETLYQLVLPDGQTMNFAANGQFTLTPATADTLQINVVYPDALAELTDYQLDLVLQQKLEFLEYFSRSWRSNWQKVTFVDLNTLQIVINNRTYTLDLFTLDDNLQKLEFLQQANWQPDEDIQEIDLRFRLPILK